jgi:hypothetical protein
VNAHNKTEAINAKTQKNITSTNVHTQVCGNRENAIPVGARAILGFPTTSAEV